MATKLTNTESVSSSDRSVVGTQPDNSTPPGTQGNQSVTNAMLAAMPANTLKGNATAGSASPGDLVMPLSTILARLAAGNIVAATASQTAALLAGTTPKTGTDTITLAKLTSLGTNGSYSITFVNGLVTSTSYTAPT